MIIIIQLVSSKKIPFHFPFKRVARIAQFTLMKKGCSPFTQITQVKIFCIFIIKGRAIRKLMGVGGKVQKIYICAGKN